MEYDTAMTSPTELLPPEAFPETDLNGNVICQSNNGMNYCAMNRPPRKSCCLVSALMIFIVTTLVMAGLFTWRMLLLKEIKVNKTIKPATPCFVRAVPVNFDKVPQTIEYYLESVRKKIKSTMEKDKSSVTMMNVIYYDKVIWEAKYTRRNDKIEDDITNTAYPVASLTKIITSLLAFKLHNDGIVTSIDDQIIKYEPKFRINNPFGNDKGKEISIRHLISYLSGLPREAPCYPDNDSNYCPYSNSHVLRQLSNSSLLFAPGTDVLYGNLQFGLAGQILSKNYTGGYRKLVHDKIFSPLDMQSSFFAVNDSLRNGMFKPHIINGLKPKFKEWGWIEPAGGLLTTIDDLAKLEIALFNNDESNFLRSALLDDFFSPVYFFPDKKTMLGSPWKIKFQKGYLIYIKNGYVYGYHSALLLVPHLRLAANLLTTSHNVGIEKTMRDLINFFHDELEKTSGNRHLTPVKNPERFLGVYYTNNVITLAKQDIVISLSKNGNNTHQVLAIQLEKYNFDLAYIGDNVFEIIHKQCFNFELGVNKEKVYFPESNDPNQKLMKFVIYGIHLRGKATFYRKD